MRSFYHLEIYDKIRANPYAYIGQRKFSLLESYMMQFDAMTTVKFNSEKTEWFKQMPSMRAFISSELNLQIPESVRWTWAIGFETEDQRELLENYFTWIDSYEHAFPVNRNDYQFESSLNVDIDMTDFIKHMCERPIMYGFNNLSELRANIDGFFYFKSVYNMKLTKNEELLKSFIERWKKKVNTDIKFETWDRPLLKEKMGIHPFTFGGGSNGGWIFKRFVEIVEEETAIKLKDLK